MRAGTVHQDWPPFNGPLARLPDNRKEVIAIFGNPGEEFLSPLFEQRSIVKSVIPGLPRALRCHYLAEPYIREAFRRAQEVAPGFFPLEAAGCFNYRPTASNPDLLSMHSWGIAVDIEPKLNRAITLGKSDPGIEAWSERWLATWPQGLSQAFVRAFQSVGFAWGSDWDEDGSTRDHRFLDPMHFELVHRGGELHRV